MKGKDKAFVFLDPAAAQTRRNRVQFMLDDHEYATLKSAAVIQATKPSDLAGALFRKHILPGLAEEVQRLHEAPAQTAVANRPALAVQPSPNGDDNGFKAAADFPSLPSEKGAKA